MQYFTYVRKENFGPIVATFICGVLCNGMKTDSVQSSGHCPVLQIELQMLVVASILFGPRFLINFAEIPSSPDSLSFFKIVIACSISAEAPILVRSRSTLC